ncbi:hypothetical protein DBV15_08557 [Temnothorax longispinosus]|uniref:Uncharacterized protein n=1 Tax=Temnothorax longispinosus TaxID=300112 RepID=A0A4S2L4B6_9HYME|nr:hypothetical protein DBV15_08557 [Temnothorax longispinosus]
MSEIIQKFIERNYISHQGSTLSLAKPEQNRCLFPSTSKQKFQQFEIVDVHMRKVTRHSSKKSSLSSTNVELIRAVLRTEEGKWLVITACRLAGWLTLRIVFRVLRQVSKSENELYDLFTPYWVMGPGYIAVVFVEDKYVLELEDEQKFQKGHPLEYCLNQNFERKEFRSVAIGLAKVGQVHSHKWTWTTVGHRWGYKSAGDVFCLYRRYWIEKGEEEKKRRRNKKLQHSACYKRTPVRQTPSRRMTWGLKGTKEGKEGLEGDPEGTMPKVTRKNVNIQICLCYAKGSIYERKSGITIYIIISLAFSLAATETIRTLLNYLQFFHLTRKPSIVAWREWDGLTLMRLAAPPLRIDQKDRLRLPDLLWWTIDKSLCQKYKLILNSFNDRIKNLRTGKNWSAERVMERDCLYTRKSEEGIVKCDRKATTAVWERQTPCYTAAPIEGVKGGGGEWTSVWVSGEQGRAAACCPHQAPLRIFHREFTSLDTTGKLQEWRSNLSLLASMGSLFFSQVPFPERPSSRTHMYRHIDTYMAVKTIAFQPSYCAIIMRKIATTIHPTCFIAIFHPHLSPRRVPGYAAVNGKEEKHRVKKIVN